MQQLPGNIKFLRQSKKMTQEELGEILSLKKAAISRYENGLSFPPSDKLYELAKIFEVTLDDLANSDLSRIDRMSIIKDSSSKYFTRQELYNIHELVYVVQDLRQKMNELEQIVDKLKQSIKDQ